MKTKFAPFSLLICLALLLAACAPVASQPELAGTQWRLTGLNGSQVSAAAPITLEVEIGGQLGGSAGCNSYGGAYTLDARMGTISFAGVISTMMACQDETVMANEGAYLQALNSTASYQVQGNTLTLSDGDQSLIFSRQ